MISPYLISGTAVSPTIDFNPENGRLQITGRSIPEHPVKFYQPIENWLNEFLSTEPQIVHLSIYMDYINTHSTECLLILLKRLQKYMVNNPEKKVKVEWSLNAEDEDMQTLGEDLAELSKIPFYYKHVL